MRTNSVHRQCATEARYRLRRGIQEDTSSFWSSVQVIQILYLFYLSSLNNDGIPSCVTVVKLLKCTKALFKIQDSGFMLENP